MKKVTSLMVSAAIISASLLPAIAAEPGVATEYTAGDGTVYVYVIRKDGLCIDKIIPAEGIDILNLPAEIDGMPVYRVSYLGSKGDTFDGITKVNIPEGIEDIELSGFNDLEEITIPSTVKSLRDEAFLGCEALEKVTLSEGLTRIGNMCFMNCTSLKSITIPDSVTLIADYAFAGCTSLETVEWDKNSEMGTNVFDETKYLSESDEDLLLLNDGTVLYSAMGKSKTVEIPESVTEIFQFAFNNSAVEKVIWPESLDTIGQNAFYGATNLKEIEFKGRINKIENCAFQGCTSLTEPIIPDGITEIPWGCFSYCSGIKTAEIPDSVTKIDQYAFAYNDNLSNLKFNEGLESIEPNAFEICKSLKEVVIPSTVEKIGSRAFNECSSLSKLEIKSAATIEKAAFCGTNLKEENITLAEGVVYEPVEDNKRYEDDPLEFLYDEDSDAEVEPVYATRKPTVTEKPRAVKPTDEPEDAEKPKATATPNPTEKPKASPTPNPDAVPVLEVKNQNDEIEITVEDENVIFPDAKPFIDENDRTQVPVRAVSETLGFAVNYNEGEVTISNNERVITLRIGEQNMIIDFGYGMEYVTMDTAAVIVDDRTYVPIRFVAEMLGYTVEYVG